MFIYYFIFCAGLILTFNISLTRKIVVIYLSEIKETIHRQLGNIFSLGLEVLKATHSSW